MPTIKGNIHYVKFIRSSAAAWANLLLTPAKIDDDTLYFIYEASNTTKGKLYLGQRLISGVGEGDSSSVNISDIGGIYIDDETLENKQVLVYNETNDQWENTPLSDIIGETVSVMTGAGAAADGTAGLVPQPRAGQQANFLRGDGTWASINIPIQTSLSGGSAAANDKTVVGGVTVSGHAVTVAKKTMTAGAGISITGVTDKITIAHSNSITAGTAKGDDNKTLTFGGTFTIPTVTYDGEGHVTGKGTTTMTMPANPNTDIAVKQTVKTDNVDYKILTTTSASPTSGSAAEAGYGANLAYNPSTNTLKTGNANLTGTLNVTGQATFNQIPVSITPEANSNDTSVATTAFIKNAISGLSGAMHFRGTTTTAITDGSTTNPITISGNSYTAAAGDVVLREVTTGNIFEYIWTGSFWEMLGRDTSFKITQSAIPSPTANGNTTAFIDTISQDANGNITVTKKNLDTSGTWSGTAAKAIADGSGNNIIDTYLTKTVGVTDVSWTGNTDKKISKTINGVASDIIQFEAGDNVALTATSNKLTIAAIEKIYPVHVTLTNATEGISDKSHSEILTAVNEQKIPFVYIDYAGSKLVASLLFANQNRASFVYNDQSSSSMNYAFLSIVNKVVTINWRGQYVASDELGSVAYDDIVPIERGGTGNTDGYIRTGQKSGNAIGASATAEGIDNIASGDGSHAEGVNTTASGSYSHVEGFSTIAKGIASHVFGEYNEEDVNNITRHSGEGYGNYVEIVGNGSADNARSNARTLDWNGNEILAGKLTVGINPTNDMDVATKQYVDNAIGSGSGSGGGGSSNEEILLGQTPLTLTEDASKLILSGSGTYDYTIESETQIEPDISSGTFSNATLTYEDNQYKLKAGSGATSWYQAYVDINVSGLIQGAEYNFIFDGAGCTYDETTHITVGHFILYDGNGSTLVTRGNTDTNKKNIYAFTAPTSTARIRWYTATNNTYSAGVSVANINGFYFNREGTTNHTVIVNLSGSFTDTTELRNIPAGCLIDADPTCQVSYKVGEYTGTYAPLKDKTIVCFGDSLFGMYRGDTSATSYIEQYTGATVYNVGFGGCRMSTHPSHGYAEFSMYRLAQAIANNNWTDQDTYASQGSSYFPEQLTTLKSIDFSKVDYAVIHYGTNDFGGNVIIENSNNNMDTSTICGALRTSISTLLGAYPKIQLFISLPVYRYWTSNNVNTYAETYKNTKGNTLPQVVEAIRKIAIEYHLPVIDGYNGMGINNINASQFLEDGTHHNQAGRERFGNFIAQQLLSHTNYYVDNSIPSSASISSGVISFANSSGTTLFTITLPLYNGGVT